MQRSLLIGCGNSREKKIVVDGDKDWTGELTTLDINPNCGADVVFDLERMSVLGQDEFLRGKPVLPFEDETFDELAAYDVLEHFGRQGDWRGWFTQMSEFHRILKPGGHFGIIVPVGRDALVDPGHTRFFDEGWFHFLRQDFYAKALEEGAPVTDYRWFNRCWWDILFMQREENHHIGVMLQKA